MSGKRQDLVIAGGIAVLIVVVLMLVLQLYGLQTKPQKPVIGMILQGKMTDKGWNHQNYIGIRDATNKLGLQLEVCDDMQAGSEALQKSIKDMEKEKKLLFLSSADYEADMRQSVRNGSNLIFALPALEIKPNGQCIPYFIRLYQGEYLAGVLAGMRTQTGRIGYVASMPVPETTRGVNAFTLGVHKTNPAAQVIVYWVGSWDDASREIYGANALIDAGVDVMNSHQDRANVQKTADQRGIDYINYQEPMEDASGHNIATMACDWSIVYEKIMQDYQQGRLQPMYWMGIPEGAVDLSDFSAAVTDSQRDMVEKTKRAIYEGQTVFSGEIRDRQGVLRCEKDETINDEALVHMNWYVEGVRFYDERN